MGIGKDGRSSMQGGIQDDGGAPPLDNPPDDDLTVIVLAPAVPGGLPAGDKLPWFVGATDEVDALLDSVRRAWAALPSSARPGAQTGRLRDEGEIARGAMGTIRQQYDVDLRRRVALKVIDSELGADPVMTQRFLDEARITGGLDHPNIVPVYDLGTDENGSASYSMKLVEGRTLGQLIAAQVSQHDLERILQCLAGVCDALAFAHGRGVVHRDLKPDNIMVGEHGQVYLMDWGCALVTGGAQRLDRAADPEGSVIGTVPYMAPEQARGEISRIDARTDIFAIGAILYKTLTGRAPYNGTFDEALHLARNADFRPPDESRGAAVRPPPMLSAIVKKAMARDPADRYASAAELARALRAFMRGGNWFPQHIYPAGTVIVREGDRADAAFILTSGRCEVRKSDPADPSRYLSLRVLQAGDVFGETAIFANMPRSASVVALDDVGAVVVDRGSLDELVADTYLGRFVKALADRFLDLDARLQAKGEPGKS